MTDQKVTSAKTLFYAVGPNCWGKGVTMKEAIKNARRRWPRFYGGFKRPSDKMFSVWEITSDRVMGFGDLHVDPVDGESPFPITLRRARFKHPCSQRGTNHVTQRLH